MKKKPKLPKFIGKNYCLINILVVICYILVLLHSLDGRFIILYLKKDVFSYLFIFLMIYYKIVFAEYENLMFSCFNVKKATV